MKLITTFCLIAVIVSASQASILHDIADSGLETLFNSGLKMLIEKSRSPEGLLGNTSSLNVSSTYQLLKTFLACDSGVSALVDSVFTVIDLGESDQWNW